MAGVFISYRRADSGGWAGRLKDHLEMRFGSDLVWQDVDDIPPGANWLEQIKSGIEHADSVLVVIGPRWLELGGRRMQDPNDVLRTEISLALSSTALIIPVLVGGAEMPGADDLPPPVQPLLQHQAVVMLDSDWQRSVHLLVEALREAVEKTRERLPLQEIHDQLYRMQSEFFDLLGTDGEDALTVTAQALALLDRQQPQYPQDVRLQLFRGYFEKNKALALGERGNSVESAAAVARADRVFQVMRGELEAHVAGAYNGIGSVAIMQGRFNDALQWIDKALELIPNYPDALHDREIVLQQLGRRIEKPRPRPRTRRSRQ
jgi:tetratricopeptide (TPR) repeat protein